MTKELRQDLTDMQQEALTGVFLDLRDNPGGILGEAVGVASQLLKGGNVLLVKNAEGTTRAFRPRSKSRCRRKAPPCSPEGNAT